MKRALYLDTLCLIIIELCLPFQVTIAYPSETKSKHLEGHYGEVSKYLALGLPKKACKVLWNSKEKDHLKELLFSEIDNELQGLCSTSNPSLLRECSSAATLLDFSLDMFTDELYLRAPLLNDLMGRLCLSERQKKRQRSGTAVASDRSQQKLSRAAVVKASVISMVLNCRCDDLLALSVRTGLIVRLSGAGRKVLCHLYLFTLFPMDIKYFQLIFLLMSA